MDDIHIHKESLSIGEIVTDNRLGTHIDALPILIGNIPKITVNLITYLLHKLCEKIHNKLC